MSRADQIQRDMQRAARRAKRLAERAEERVGRRASRARKAAARAEELADRVSKKAKSHSRELDRNIEDLVDQVTDRWSQHVTDRWSQHVTDRWSQKAERWLESASDQLFEGEDHQGGRPRRRDGVDGRASRTRTAADGSHPNAETLDTETVAEEMKYHVPGSDDTVGGRRRRSNRTAEEAGPDMSRSEREYRRRQRRAARRSQRSTRQHRRSASRRMGYHKGLYRDPDRKKVCGVCAGLADYFGVESWQVRLGAILGLIFIPQLTISGYFIAYFLMDKKPYYRRVTDRFDRAERQWQDPEDDEQEDQFSVSDKKSRESSYRKPRVSNALALRTATSKFTELEERLRSMESHVTSSKFELQRELKKLSGEN